MNLEYQQYIPQEFSDTSRVWIYQSSRLLLMQEALAMEPLLNEFVSGWHSHGVPVKGYANLFFGQFLIIMADETATGVSGCSTDSSVKLVKQIEQLFNVNMFDRQMLAFIIKDKLQLLPMAQLQYAFDNNFITRDTLYFNNLVGNKQQLLTNWIIPLKESWLTKKLQIPSSI